MQKMVRQGDVLFIPTIEELSPRETIEDGIIQAGEATGHHHRVAVLEDAQVFTINWQGEKGLRVGPNGVSIVHEEHHEVRLEPDTTYKVHIAREYDYMQQVPRRVFD